MSKKRLTVLVGAGGSVELGLPSTNDLTNKLHFLRIPYNSGSDSVDICYFSMGKFIDSLKSKLINNINFEQVLHALEIISTFNIGWKQNIHPSVKALESVLVENPGAEFGSFFGKQTAVMGAKDELYQLIFNEIMLAIKKIKLANISDNIKLLTNWEIYKNFWEALSNKFTIDIVTLNYDNCIEYTTIPVENGFEEIQREKCYRFNSNKFNQCSKNRILHIHGSIHYGYRNFEPNRFIYEDDFEDLYYYDDPDDAVQTWFHRSTNRAQDGREATIGPIITGLQKTSKLLAEPYITYYSEFANILRRNSRLLVIGYGFSDPHINCLIKKMTRYHKNKRRIVYIGYKPECEWKPSECWSTTEQDMFWSIGMWSEEPRPANDPEYKNPWVSKNQLCRVYWEGLISTALDHCDNLLEFLSCLKIR